MFVKTALSSDPKIDFSIQMTTREYANRANAVLSELEERFLKVGLDPEEIYVNDNLLEILQALDKKSLESKTSESEMIRLTLSALRDLDAVVGKRSTTGEFINDTIIRDFSKEIRMRMLSTLRKAERKFRLSEQISFEIAVITIAQATKQRRFSYSIGSYDDRCTFEEDTTSVNTTKCEA